MLVLVFLWDLLTKGNIYNNSSRILYVNSSQQQSKSEAIYSTNANNNMEILFYIQSVCSQYTTTLNVKNVWGGKSAVSERWMEKVQSLGSVLTNSILCCCSCFHGALSPSLLFSLSLSHSHTHAHTSVWKRIQLCESICNQTQLRERTPRSL